MTIPSRSITGRYFLNFILLTSAERSIIIEHCIINSLVHGKLSLLGDLLFLLSQLLLFFKSHYCLLVNCQKLSINFHFLHSFMKFRMATFSIIAWCITWKVHTFICKLNFLFLFILWIISNLFFVFYKVNPLFSGLDIIDRSRQSLNMHSLKISQTIDQ